MQNPSSKSLGKLVAVHGVAPAHLQRAVFIAVLSFLFFMATMVMFYLFASALYFLLSTAFLVIYILTMFSWVAQRRNVVQVFENGISKGRRSAAWSEIEKVCEDGTIKLRNGKTIKIATTVTDFEPLISLLQSKAEPGA